MNTIHKAKDTDFTLRGTELDVCITFCSLHTVRLRLSMTADCGVRVPDKAGISFALKAFANRERLGVVSELKESPRNTHLWEHLSTRGIFESD